MRRTFHNTKVSVKLRKSCYANEWYLVVESYPVYEKANGKPKRIRENINRVVTTPLWDKSKTTRGGAGGKVAYMPKRDVNGVIQCKSAVDQRACLYADKIREARQREYDNAALYTDMEAAQAEQNERSKCNFIEYVKYVSEKRHGNGSKSIIINWKRVYELLKLFAKGDSILFSEIDLRLIEEFKQWIITAPQGGGKSGTISQNTAATYFSIFKAALHQAFIDGYLTIDMAAKSKNIQEQESRREFLTTEELNTLASTPCDNPTIKRAALFSALTGLRHCDIQKLKWSEVQKINNTYRLNFTQKKTKGVEYMPMSEQAYKLCGERKDPHLLVFAGLPAPAWISKPLKRWIEAAGITRKITFHCFRHTYATLQLAHGTDIYTVSKMLGHTNVKTTQIYAKVIDEKKEKAANAIQINLNENELE